MKFLILNRVNFKKFFGLSILPTAITLFLSHNNKELGLFLLMYAATLLYVFMFSEAIFNMTQKYKDEEYKVSNKYIATLFVLKLFILVGAILFSVQTLGSRIIIPILNYIIHIFILGVSVKKT